MSNMLELVFIEWESEIKSDSVWSYNRSADAVERNIWWKDKSKWDFLKLVSVISLMPFRREQLVDTVAWQQKHVLSTGSLGQSS